MSTLPPLTQTPPDGVVHLIAARLDTLHADMQDIKGTQKDLAAAFSKLILIEERQANTAAAQERSFKAIEKLDLKLEAHAAENRETFQGVDRRVAELEKAEPMQQQTSKWVMGAVWGALGLLAAWLATRILDKVF